MSAQESRRKKKDYVDSLEKQYVKLSKTFNSMKLSFCVMFSSSFIFYVVETWMLTEASNKAVGSI